MSKSHKIKQVIQSTEKLLLLPKLMQLVSASKLPGALSKFNQARPYADLAKKIMLHYTEIGQHPYFQPRTKTNAHGLIVITS